MDIDKPDIFSTFDTDIIDFLIFQEILQSEDDEDETEETETQILT